MTRFIVRRVLAALVTRLIPLTQGDL
jgi:hypothetical protein